MTQAALLDASVGGAANGLRDAHIANNIKVNRVHPSDEWFRTVLASINESDAMSWFASSVSETDRRVVPAIKIHSLCTRH